MLLFLSFFIHSFSLLFSYLPLSLSLTQCFALPHSSLTLFFFLLSFSFAFCLRRSCRRGFVVACWRGFRFCSGSNGWVSILWVRGFGFTGVGLWWLGFVGMGLPAWVCGGCGLRWPWVSGFGDEGVPACVAWVA